MCAVVLAALSVLAASLFLSVGLSGCLIARLMRETSVDKPQVVVPFFASTPTIRIQSDNAPHPRVRRDVSAATTITYNKRLATDRTEYERNDKHERQ